MKGTDPKQTCAVDFLGTVEFYDGDDGAFTTSKRVVVGLDICDGHPQGRPLAL